MDRLNCFAHYKSKSETHEDALTRAYLVLLRLIPEAHRQFLEMVVAARGPRHPALPDSGSSAPAEAIIQTQTGSLPRPVARVLSILLTDEHFAEAVQVGPSDRRPRYDGVIAYGSEWAFTIENKPRHEHVSEKQLCPNIEGAANAEVESVAVVLEWKAIIRRLGDLLKRDDLTKTALGMVQDFLDYVLEDFAFLNPYDNLALCRGSRYLANRRCIEIMEEITPGRVGYHRGWKHFMRFDGAPAKQVALDAEGEGTTWKIALHLCPGDTIAQARMLYTTLEPELLSQLPAHDWEIRPNFHLAFRSDNLIWFATSLPALDYAAFWKTHMPQIQQWSIGDTEFNAAFVELLRAWRRFHLISEDDIARAEAVTVATARQHVNVCPGLYLACRWSAEAATELDGQGKLRSSVVGKLKEAFACWGQTLL